jgi:hypothetical protein
VVLLRREVKHISRSVHGGVCTNTDLNLALQDESFGFKWMGMRSKKPIRFTNHLYGRLETFVGYAVTKFSG